MKPRFDDLVRAAVILAGIVGVGYLAVQQNNPQIALVAAGALISTLTAATNYLFRGKVQTTTPPPPHTTVG